MAGLPYIVKEIQVPRASGRPKKKGKRGIGGFGHGVKRALGTRATPEEREKAIEKCLRRIYPGRGREAFRDFLRGLLDQNALPLELLEDVPERLGKAGRTRFDQLYDACMFLAFPTYRGITNRKAFGPDAPGDMRLWRAIYPRELGVTHVVLRARSFQEAFALACDYACRLTLRDQKRIPVDLTVRVMFIGDYAVSRMVAIRHAVRGRTRSNRQTGPGRTFSRKDILGARLVAIGRKDGDAYSIFRYVEDRELKILFSKKGITRVSAVDIETFPSKEEPPPYDDP